MFYLSLLGCLLTEPVYCVRQHLVKLLDESVEIMENSHSKWLLQHQNQVDALVVEFKAALTGKYQKYFSFRT